ncbi:MAG: DUF1573 domain-containing protein [Bacteroidia bacterium]|nr:DUF1573 domain-containing protein [Bacteroidia bacterium]
MKPIFTLLALAITLFITSCDPTPAILKNETPIPSQEVNLTQIPGPAAEATPVSEMSPTSIGWTSLKKDFGKVVLEEALVHKFTFKNTGDQPLKLLNVKPSCQCTASSYTREEIAPGGTGFVEATFTPKAAGIFTKTLTVTTNTPERNHVLTLTGEGQQPNN